MRSKAHILAPDFRLVPACLILASLAIFVISAKLDPYARALLADSFSTSAAFGAAFLCFRAGLTATNGMRTGWRLAGLGAGAWALGEAIWWLYEVALNTEVPFPSVADLAYLAGYPLLLAAVLHLAMPGRSVARVRSLLDATILTLIVAVPVWHYILEPIQAASDSSLTERLLTAAYPVGDLLVLFGLAVAAMRRWREREGMVLLVLGGGLSVFLATDLAFALASLSNTFATGSLMDVGWQTGYILIGLSAYLQLRWRPAHVSVDPARTSSPWRQVVPISLLLPLVVWFALVGHEKEGTALLVGLSGVSVIVLAVVVRSALTFADVLSLNRSLALARVDLEAANRELRERGAQINNLLIEAIDVARRDSLTGLLNHGAIIEEIERALRDGLPVSVAILDVDHMKQVNDLDGHLAGDALLRQIADCLAALDGVVAGRYGGDEFLVLSRGQIREAEVAKLVAGALQGVAEPGPRSTQPATVSIGVARHPDDGDTAEALIHKADERLYLEKQGKGTARRLSA